MELLSCNRSIENEDSNFASLSTEKKIEKLTVDFENIVWIVAKKSWIFRCCRNYFVFKELYKDFLDMMCDIRSFAWYILDDEDIESRPACFNHKPSMGGLDFLTNDLEIIMDVFHESLKSNSIRQDDKLNLLFNLSICIYDMLDYFEEKYG